MLGNVAEWTADTHHADYLLVDDEAGGFEPVVDPLSQQHFLPGFPQNTVRGGAWRSLTASVVRSAARKGVSPRHRSSTRGFRVARTVR